MAGVNSRRRGEVHGARGMVGLRALPTPLLLVMLVAGSPALPQEHLTFGEALQELAPLPMPVLPMDISEFTTRLALRGDSLLVTGGGKHDTVAWAARFLIEPGPRPRLLQTISAPRPRRFEGEFQNLLLPAWLPDGGFILADYSRQHLLRYDARGELAREFNFSDGRLGIRHGCYALAVTPDDELIVAGESTEDYRAVHVYDLELGHRRSFWTLTRRIARGPGTNMDLVLDRDGSLWLAHGQIGAAHHFDRQGHLLGTVPEPVGLFRALGRPPFMASRKRIAKWYRSAVFFGCLGPLPDSRLVLCLHHFDESLGGYTYVLELVDPRGGRDPLVLRTTMRPLAIDRQGILYCHGRVDETRPWSIRRFKLRPEPE